MAFLCLVLYLATYFLLQTKDMKKKKTMQFVKIQKDFKNYTEKIYKC